MWGRKTRTDGLDEQASQAGTCLTAHSKGEAEDPQKTLDRATRAASAVTAALQGNIPSCG
jgi:hypothetical protein